MQPYLPNHEQHQLQPYTTADPHHLAAVLACQLIPLFGSAASGLYPNCCRYGSAYTGQLILSGDKSSLVLELFSVVLMIVV